MAKKVKVVENDWSILAHKIDMEGFDYCFDGYSDWKEIKDEDFHKLRKAYVAAKKAFEKYLNDKLPNIEED